MKSKRILKFYFGAEGLNSTLDKLILKVACSSCRVQSDGEREVSRVLALVGAKEELSKLWGYLDGVISEMSEEDKKALEEYSSMRCGEGMSDAAHRRGIKKSLMKFARHARIAERFSEGMRLVNEYYCLLPP